ncbi:MAG: hypothetical protein LBP72_10095 [Dysgonamonadaceae bacterium]|nr:hypothetical protein [Dysgonamonadaceae bacterium]
MTLLGALAAPGAITFSNTKICGVGTTFTAGITPVAGATSYVWTLPNGLTGSSTVTSITIGWTTEGVYSDGSISVQAVNSCGDVGASSSSGQTVKVGAIPDVPVGGTVSNSGATFTFSATPAPGCTIDWYDSATGGAKVATGELSYSTTLSARTTYYAESRNTTTDCVSSSRLAVESVGIYSVSNCDLTHSYGGNIITNSKNVRFTNGDTYTRNGITLSASVKIVERNPKSSLASSANTTVDYRDHSTANYGSFFTWCMVATHADILCPSPWRVPTLTDFQNYSGISSGSTTSIYGRPVATASEAIDGWLLGGRAYSGNDLSSVGSSGYYWSSTESSSSSGYDAAVTSSNFNPSNSTTRYVGFLLRCVKTAP